MNCAICNIEMKEHESNNPAPLLMDENDRVCRECNYFVTASRLHLRSFSPLETAMLGDIFADILKTAFALKEANKQHIKQWMLQEEEE